MTDLRTAAQQALEALEWHYHQGHSNTLGGLRLKIDEKALRNLRAALAQQAEPDHETRAELAEQQVVQLAEERDHYRNLWQKAQQAEPVQDQRCRAEPRSDGDFVCDCKIGECPGRSAALARQAEPTLTIERLRDALVASRIIPPAAVEDPDEYDDGVTLHRIEALHRRIA